VSSSVSRARRRNKAAEQDENRFEKESGAFFTRVHEAFLEIARREPERVVMIDARPPIETVHQVIVRVVRERLVLEGAHL
jgi:dTMP kinase